MKKKLERFVASLSDREIESQLSDIFEWAKVYKAILEKEKAYRQHQGEKPCEEETQATFEGNFEFEEMTDSADSFEDYESLDFEFKQAVLQKVSTLTLEESKDWILRLKDTPIRLLGGEDILKLQFEIWACEKRVFELTNTGNMVCFVCGMSLEADAKFCGNCGTIVK